MIHGYTRETARRGFEIGRWPIRFVRLTLLLVCIGWPFVVASQDTAGIDKTVDMMVRLCVGGGHTEAMTAGGSGGADLSLRSLDVTGNLKGEFKITKSSAEGLVNGIDNALSQVAANEADKVRDCLQPVRDRLLEVMLPKTPPVEVTAVKAILADCYRRALFTRMTGELRVDAMFASIEECRDSL